MTKLNGLERILILVPYLIIELIIILELFFLYKYIVTIMSHSIPTSSVVKFENVVSSSVQLGEKFDFNNVTGHRLKYDDKPMELLISFDNPVQCRFNKSKFDKDDIYCETLFEKIKSLFDDVKLENYNVFEISSMKIKKSESIKLQKILFDSDSIDKLKFYFTMTKCIVRIKSLSSRNGHTSLSGVSKIGVEYLASDAKVYEAEKATNPVNYYDLL